MIPALAAETSSWPGDAAHATLPTLGQGACQSLEDAAVLATAVAAEDTLNRALRR